MERPEHPKTREFVYTKLVDHFGVYPENSEQRSGGRRRGMKHSESLNRLSEVLASQAQEHNQMFPDAQLHLSARVVPKVLHELNVLKIVDYSLAGDSLVFFEARLFGEGIYLEEHAKNVFRFSPASQQAYYHTGNGASLREIMQRDEAYRVIYEGGLENKNPDISRGVGQFKPRN